MNRKLQILASFFLLVYLSFLGHDLIVHNHQHGEPGQDHACLIQDIESSHDSSQAAKDCDHQANPCPSCENDQGLHRQLIFAKDFKSDPHVLLPSKKIRLSDICFAHTKVYVQDFYPDESWLQAATLLRGPPSLI